MGSVDAPELQEAPSALDAAFASPVRANTHFRRLSLSGDDPQLCIVTGRVASAESARGSARPNQDTSSCGSGLSWATAWTRSAAEMLERLCATAVHDARYVHATGAELGSRALDLGKVAVCSEQELAHPNCVLRRASKDAPIRWVEGIDLLSQQTVLLPAVMVHTHLQAEPSERFWFQNTSGCAAHVTYLQAIAGAICELVERDAITTLWLQRMSLPQIDIDVVSPVLAPAWEAYLRASRHVVFSFYDATRDTGIPTVYGIRRTTLDPEVATVVACASASSPHLALEKAMRDLTVSRQGFRSSAKRPESWDDFRSPHHGSSYMAQSGQKHAFDFLLQTKQRIQLSSMSSLPEEPAQLLTTLLWLLERIGCSVFAADLTTPEAHCAGLRVVRVLIPELQPLSFHYRARFLGHHRLYRVPEALGLRVYSEREINVWPQPFY